MKNIRSYIISGALLGALLVGWLAPEILAWYFTPPVQISITCKEPVAWGIYTYRKAILIGTGVGAGFGLVFAFWIRSKMKSKTKDPQRGPTNASP